MGQNSSSFQMASACQLCAAVLVHVARRLRLDEALVDVVNVNLYILDAQNFLKICKIMNHWNYSTPDWHAKFTSVIGNDI